MHFINLKNENNILAAVSFVFGDESDLHSEQYNRAISIVQKIRKEAHAVTAAKHHHDHHPTHGVNKRKMYI